MGTAGRTCSWPQIPEQSGFTLTAKASGNPISALADGLWNGSGQAISMVMDGKYRRELGLNSDYRCDKDHPLRIYSVDEWRWSNRGRRSVRRCNVEQTVPFRNLLRRQLVLFLAKEVF
jgi:hypothetical protein